MRYSPEDVKALAAAIYAEARGESRRGQRAVGHVIVNRATVADRPVSQVVYARGQFSGLAPGDPNRKAAEALDPSSPEAAGLIDIATQILSGKSVDPTNNATFYHADEIAPAWKNGAGFEKTVRIGGHDFYTAPSREVRANVNKPAVAAVKFSDAFDEAVRSKLPQGENETAKGGRFAPLDGKSGEVVFDESAPRPGETQPTQRRQMAVDNWSNPLGEAFEMVAGAPPPRERPAEPVAFTEYAGMTAKDGKTRRQIAGMTDSGRQLLRDYDANLKRMGELGYAVPDQTVVTSAFRTYETDPRTHPTGTAADLRTNGLEGDEIRTMAMAAVAGGAKGLANYVEGDRFAPHLHIDKVGAWNPQGQGPRTNFPDLNASLRELGPEATAAKIRETMDAGVTVPPGLLTPDFVANGVVPTMQPPPRPDEPVVPDMIAAASPDFDAAFATFNDQGPEFLGQVGGMGSAYAAVPTPEMAAAVPPPAPQASAPQMAPVVPPAPPAGQQQPAMTAPVGAPAGQQPVTDQPAPAGQPQPPTPIVGRELAQAQEQALELGRNPYDLFRSTPEPVAPVGAPEAQPAVPAPEAGAQPPPEMAAPVGAPQPQAPVTGQPAAAQGAPPPEMAAPVGGPGMEPTVPPIMASAVPPPAALPGQDPALPGDVARNPFDVQRGAPPLPGGLPPTPEPRPPGLEAIATPIPDGEGGAFVPVDPADVANGTAPAAPGGPAPVVPVPDSVRPRERPDWTTVGGAAGKIGGGIAGGMVFGLPGMRLGGLLGEKLGKWIDDTPVRAVAGEYIKSPAAIEEAVKAGYSSPDGALNSTFDSGRYWKSISASGFTNSDLGMKIAMSHEQRMRKSAGLPTWGDALDVKKNVGKPLAEAIVPKPVRDVVGGIKDGVDAVRDTVKSAVQAPIIAAKNAIKGEPTVPAMPRGPTDPQQEAVKSVVEDAVQQQKSQAESQAQQQSSQPTGSEGSESTYVGEPTVTGGSESEDDEYRSIGGLY